MEDLLGGERIVRGHAHPVLQVFYVETGAVMPAVDEWLVVSTLEPGDRAVVACVLGWGC